eukprot:m51a1_g4411 2',3'-cyclic-nucleotide 2'-phosphodiesterase, putative (1732) ;mRNA; r:439240-446501
MSFTVVHTNDFHGHLEGVVTGTTLTGGAPYLTGCQRAVEQRSGSGDVLVLDAGDITLGAMPISQLVNGSSAIEYYNLRGVQAACPGNHEFDLGLGVFQARIQQSKFPWLAANIVVAGTEWQSPSYLRPYHVFNLTHSGLRVGVIGLTTTETQWVVSPGAIRGLTFRDPVDAVKRYYHEVRNSSDVLVLLGHVPLEDVPAPSGSTTSIQGSRTIVSILASQGYPVDLFVSGHDHIALSQPYRESGAVIAEAGCWGNYLGQVIVTVDRENHTMSFSNQSTAIVLDNSTDLGNATSSCQTAALDAASDALVSEWAAWIKPMTDRFVAASSLSLLNSPCNAKSPYPAGTTECTMTLVVADAMRWAGDSVDDGVVNGSVDIGIINFGGIRASLPLDPGQTQRTINWGNTFTVCPFQNVISTFDLSGQEIQNIVVQLLKPSWYNLRPLALSGVQVYYTQTTVNSSYYVNDIVRIDVNGEPLVLSRNYRVGSVAFLLAGGDGWTELTHATAVRTTAYLDNEALNDYLIHALGGNLTNSSIQLRRFRNVPQLAQFTVVHTNDFHGHLEGVVTGTTLTGGAPYLTGCQRAVEQRSGSGDVLVLDAGDITLGAMPISQLVNGSSAIEYYNLRGVQAACPGNHEFDLGLGVFQARISQSTFPWLAANIVKKGTWECPSYLKPYHIFTLSNTGLRVGVIGLTTTETQWVVSPKSIEGLEFKEPVDAVKRYYHEVRNSSDVIVLLGHVPLEDVPAPSGAQSKIAGSQTVAAQLYNEGYPIDLFVSGHDHIALSRPYRVNNTATVVEAGCWGNYLGQVLVTVDRSNNNLKTVSNATTAIVLDNSTDLGNATSSCQTAALDAASDALVSEWAAWIKPMTDRFIATSSVDLMATPCTDKSPYPAGTTECTMTLVVADAMRWAGDLVDDGVVNDSVEIGIINFGGIRASLPLGLGQTHRTINWGNTFTVSPFQNVVSTFYLSGTDIKSIVLELLKPPYSNLRPVALSGVQVYYKQTTHNSSFYVNDLVRIEVGGKTLDLSKHYRVGSIAFLLVGGDMWTVLKNATGVRTTAYLDNEALNDYIATALHSNITNSSIRMGRFTRLSQQQQQQQQVPASIRIAGARVPTAQATYLQRYLAPEQQQLLPAFLKPSAASTASTASATASAGRRRVRRGASSSSSSRGGGMVVVDDDAGMAAAAGGEGEGEDEESAPVVAGRTADAWPRARAYVPASRFVDVGVAPAALRRAADAGGGPDGAPRKRAAAGGVGEGDTDVPRRGTAERRGDLDELPRRRATATDDADIDVPRRRHDSPERSGDLDELPRRRAAVSHAGDDDVDVPRRRHDSPERSGDLDELPRKRATSRVDDDVDVPRRRHDSPERSADLDELPRKRAAVANVGDDMDVPRRRHDSPERYGDLDELPRKRATAGRGDSDAGVPRRRHDSPERSADLDDVPRRRAAGRDDTDAPRRRHDSPERSGDLDELPRKRAAARDNEDDEDVPRRRRHDSPERAGDIDELPTRRHDSPGPREERQSVIKTVGSAATIKTEDGAVEVPAPKPNQMLMQSGMLAGLTDSKSLKEQMERIREREAKKFECVDESLRGKEAGTVIRDRHGRRLQGLEEFLRQSEGAVKAAEADEMEWGKGRVQRRAAELSAARLEEERDRPFAQYINDPELDAERKEVDRWGDPMANVVQKKKAKLNRPVYRFNIMPDFLWDGVDRSNGFEKQYFLDQAKRKALSEEAYLYSVADM